jgi:hypothetical protein
MVEGWVKAQPFFCVQKYWVLGIVFYDVYK